MTLQQLNNCLQKFYLSARRRDRTFYNKKSLNAIRAALDRHLRYIVNLRYIVKNKVTLWSVFIQLVWYILVVDIYLVASRLGNHPLLFTSTSVNNCLLLWKKRIKTQQQANKIMWKHSSVRINSSSSSINYLWMQWQRSKIAPPWLPMGLKIAYRVARMWLQSD